MPIAKKTANGQEQLLEEAFRDEDELQVCLERNPYLLALQSEPGVAAVQREVGLPAAGILDLLCVDAEGVPIAVEVKLARNGQSRREVIAQAFDYVSDLTLLTVDELDDLVDGALLTALGELNEEEAADALRKQCGTNLRAGRIKVVVAVDEPNDDLLRIVRYINDHSDLDVRLVAISKFDGGRLLVPRVLVSGGTATVSVSQARRTSMSPSLEAVINAYDQTAEASARTSGNSKAYRFIKPDGVPRGLHYEFRDRAAGTSVELHLESENVRQLGDVLSGLDGTTLFPGATTTWNQKWSKNRGRLILTLGQNGPPEQYVKAMQALIAHTKPIIDKEMSQ